jgi:hypothetical protein
MPHSRAAALRLSARPGPFATCWYVGSRSARQGRPFQTTLRTASARRLKSARLRCAEQMPPGMSSRRGCLTTVSRSRPRRLTIADLRLFSLAGVRSRSLDSVCVTQGRPKPAIGDLGLDAARRPVFARSAARRPPVHLVCSIFALKVALASSLQRTGSPDRLQRGEIGEYAHSLSDCLPASALPMARPYHPERPAPLNFKPLPV